MINKRLRFLIVDECRINCMLIEKYLNNLGYYRVATTQNFSEMLILVQVGPVPFDLVIFNAAVVSRYFDLSALLEIGRHVRHSLIYNQKALSLSNARARSLIEVDLSELPGEKYIEELLKVIERGSRHLSAMASPGAPNTLVQS